MITVFNIKFLQLVQTDFTSVGQVIKYYIEIDFLIYSIFFYFIWIKIQNLIKFLFSQSFFRSCTQKFFNFDFYQFAVYFKFRFYNIIVFYTIIDQFIQLLYIYKSSLVFESCKKFTQIHCLFIQNFLNIIKLQKSNINQHPNLDQQLVSLLQIIRIFFILITIDRFRLRPQTQIIQIYFKQEYIYISLSILLVQYLQRLQSQNRFFISRIYIIIIMQILESNKNNAIDSIFIHQSGHTLYISDFTAAINLSLLKNKNIKAVLTAASQLQITFNNQSINHRVYQIVDTPSYNIAKHFQDSYDFIECQLCKSSVLIHCAAGISRSATIAIAYLMRKNNWSFRKSYKSLKMKRKIICPNPGFEKQLYTFQNILQFQNNRLNDYGMRKIVSNDKLKIFSRSTKNIEFQRKKFEFDSWKSDRKLLPSLQIKSTEKGKYHSEKKLKKFKYQLI